MTSGQMTGLGPSGEINSRKNREEVQKVTTKKNKAKDLKRDKEANFKANLEYFKKDLERRKKRQETQKNVYEKMLNHFQNSASQLKGEDPGKDSEDDLDF